MMMMIIFFLPCFGFVSTILFMGLVFRPVVLSPVTIPSPACAACQQTRKHCSNNCSLARYFPANDPERFRSVIRWFGYSNLMSTVEQVYPSIRDEAMQWIILESEMRRGIPAQSCFGITPMELHAQFEKASQAFRAVNDLPCPVPMCVKEDNRQQRESLKYVSIMACLLASIGICKGNLSSGFMSFGHKKRNVL